MPRFADSRGKEQGALPDLSVFPDLDDQGIHKNEGKDSEWSLAPLLDERVEGLAELRDKRFTEARPAQFLSDRLDFPGGDPLEYHFTEGKHEGLLASLVSLP